MLKKNYGYIPKVPLTPNDYQRIAQHIASSKTLITAKQLATSWGIADSLAKNLLRRPANARPLLRSIPC